ncbi:MAG: hypothetical protein NWR97_05390 [Salibacteraceae bacterium]|nr:hypothetical protein [Salibacteraceae bacterium]MDP4763072.1 hypothetical protein [Salibacteraceae bacterium]
MKTTFAQDNANVKYPSFIGSQLQFSSAFLRTPKIEFSPAQPRFSSSASNSMQFGIGYYQPLKYRFGFSLSPQFRVFGYRIEDISFFEDPLSGDIETSKFGETHYDLHFALPLMFVKQLVVRDRHFLNVGVGLGFNYLTRKPIESIAIIQTATDSSGSFYANELRFSEHAQWAIDYRLELGYQYMLKSQNTIGLSVFGSYSGYKTINGNYYAQLNETNYSSGSINQTLANIGAALTFGYTFKQKRLDTLEFRNIKKEPQEVYNRLWVETGISFLHVNQRIKEPNSLFETAFYSQVKFNLAVELDEKWNQRYGFGYLRYWEVGPSVKYFRLTGAGASGIFSAFFTTASFGKDLVKTKREGFKIKPWIGGAVSLFPYAFTDKNYPGSGGNGSTSFDGDTISFTHTDRYPNPFNFYASAALEFEIRVFRAMRFSITPSYTQGMLKNSVSEYTYDYNGIETGNFDLISRLSHTELRFALKIPIHYGKQVN